MDAITGTPNSLSGSPASGITNSSLRPVSSYTPPAPKASPVVSTGSSDGWSTTTIITIVLIVVLLAVLGLNIFSYLAQGTDYLGNVVDKISSVLPGKAKDLVSTTVKGADLGVDVAAGAVKDAGDVLERELNLKRTDLWNARDKGVKKGMENREILGINKYPEHEPSSTYKEDSEDNNIQERHKPGYCYIGTDRGYRSCIKVNSHDDCESKKIFPTMDICINPSLRQ